MGDSAVEEARATIVFVTDAWIVGGGAERMLFTLLKGLDKSKFRPVVFVLFDAGGRRSYSEAARELGIEVVRFRIRARLSVATTREVARFVLSVRRSHPDVVHASGDMSLGMLAGWLVRVPKRLVTVHDTSLGSRRRDQLVRLASLRWLATTTVAVSQAVASDLMQTYRVSARRIRVVHNGVDDSFLGPQPDLRHARSLADTGPTRILAVARLIPEKGLDLLLHAAALLLKEDSDLRFSIVGDGPIMRELRDLSRRLGVEGSVTFPGLVMDVGAYYLDADIFVLPSRSEGLGISAIEAMAASLPVVASASGGLPEVVVDGATGFLIHLTGCTRKDAEMLAQALGHLSSDAALARRMGAAGRRRFEDAFGARAFVEHYQRMYDS